jgi:hypothetical protein
MLADLATGEKRKLLAGRVPSGGHWTSTSGLWPMGLQRTESGSAQE